MYSHTRKIGSLGRYGVKTGKKIREEMRKIEDAGRNSTCPNCGRKIKRKSAGIWNCSFCKTTLAGGSYIPATEKTAPAEL